MADDEAISFGDYLGDLMVPPGRPRVTREELGAALGVAPQLVGQWLDGKQTPPPGKGYVEKIARYLQLDAAQTARLRTAQAYSRLRHDVRKDYPGKRVSRRLLWLVALSVGGAAAVIAVLLLGPLRRETSPKGPITAHQYRPPTVPTGRGGGGGALLHLSAELSGTAAAPQAYGNALFDDPSGSGNIRVGLLIVEIDNANLPTTQGLSVFIDGQKVDGTLEKGSTGAITAAGPEGVLGLVLSPTGHDTVSALHAGSVVEVRTERGEVLLSGQFR